eukprot:TRINITY_DN26444_c0_g1_i1.p1 TRINITY_DN26444_c0_g1~~TRINITY_DN26444_c0_g1_i1.p1  ORF type:complete len:252 (-),score=31.64 TRINITY_DN26444_c0_g1_i1:318-1073(-)
MAEDRSPGGSSRPRRSASSRRSEPRSHSAHSARGPRPLSAGPVEPKPIYAIPVRGRGGRPPETDSPVKEGFGGPRVMYAPLLQSPRRQGLDTGDSQPALAGYTEHRHHRVSQLHKTVDWVAAGYAGKITDGDKRCLKKQHSLRKVTQATDVHCMSSTAQRIREAKESYTKTVVGAAGRSAWQHELTGAQRGRKKLPGKDTQHSAIAFSGGAVQPSAASASQEFFKEKSAKRQYKSAGWTQTGVEEVAFNWV